MNFLACTFFHFLKMVVLIQIINYILIKFVLLILNFVFFLRFQTFSFVTSAARSRALADSIYATNIIGPINWHIDGILFEFGLIILDVILILVRVHKDDVSFTIIKNFVLH